MRDDFTAAFKGGGELYKLPAAGRHGQDVHLPWPIRYYAITAAAAGAAVAWPVLLAFGVGPISGFLWWLAAPVAVGTFATREVVDGKRAHELAITYAAWAVDRWRTGRVDRAATATSAVAVHPWVHHPPVGTLTPAQPDEWEPTPPMDCGCPADDREHGSECLTRPIWRRRL